MGTNDETLIRIVVSRCEVDMQNIKAEFQKAFNQSLGKFIAVSIFIIYYLPVNFNSLLLYRPCILYKQLFTLSVSAIYFLSFVAGKVSCFYFINWHVYLDLSFVCKHETPFCMGSLQRAEAFTGYSCGTERQFTNVIFFPLKQDDTSGDYKKILVGLVGGES